MKVLLNISFIYPVAKQKIFLALFINTIVKSSLRTCDLLQ